MKRLLVIALTTLTVSAVAQTTAAPDKTQKLEQKKTEWLSRLDQHIAHLQDMKSCVSSAADQAAMKACHEKGKAWRQQWKGQRKNKK